MRNYKSCIVCAVQVDKTTMTLHDTCGVHYSLKLTDKELVNQAKLWWKNVWLSQDNKLSVFEVKDCEGEALEVVKILDNWTRCIVTTSPTLSKQKYEE